MTPKEIAQKAAALMWENDNCSRWTGLKLKDIDEGQAVLSLEVQEQHTNGHGTCHGGIIFILADSAFGFACNTRNQTAVAQHNAITYIKPANLGDVLEAHAREISLNGRSGIYDVTVLDQNQELIAEFRGCSRAVNRQVFDT